jgi:Ni/Co efflux regulator RcnB
MNVLVKAVVFSISSALVATSAFAAPQPHQQDRQAVVQPQKAHLKAEQKKPNATPQKNVVKKAEKPSRDWKSGQKVPNQFQSQSYKIDYKQSKKLTKPSKNQQWIKVNGDYVLINTVSYKVIKVVS